ncbi:MAG: hypothetical protein QF371_03325, partial [Flavobacteriales bacterium]|nr:hypothetical protein [Flavobacteriales bacterium]
QSLTNQLAGGVRGLMLDVYDEGGVATVYHGFAFLGTAPLTSNLQEIKTFLDDNPNEVVTIIFEAHTNSTLIGEVFDDVQLLSYLHVQTLGDQWPTLQQMIDAGKRLVVFTDANDAGPGQEWYHDVWDFAVETDFSNHAPSDFSCDYNRGDEDNDLFILNHFVTDATIGVGLPDQSAVVNEVTFFYNRAVECAIEKQKFPNFPTVDFYELGNTLQVVDSLNLGGSLIGMEERGRSEISLVSGDELGVYSVLLSRLITQGSLEIRNAHGQLIEMKLLDNKSTIHVDLRPYLSGMYFGVLRNAEIKEPKTFRFIR